MLIHSKYTLNTQHNFHPISYWYVPPDKAYTVLSLIHSTVRFRGCFGHALPNIIVFSKGILFLEIKIKSYTPLLSQRPITSFWSEPAFRQCSPSYVRLPTCLFCIVSLEKTIGHVKNTMCWALKSLSLRQALESV